MTKEMYKLENISSKIINMVWARFRDSLSYYISGNVESYLDNKVDMSVLYSNYYFDIINIKVGYDVPHNKFKYVKYENIFLFNKVKDNFIKEII